MSNYLIGSGWWCAEGNDQAVARPYIGDNVIRSSDFHHLWSAVIDHFCAPAGVVIIDSASPTKPSITNGSYRLITLPKNPGHALAHTGHYSGWTESVLFGLEYAIASDVDYFVYIEQDALIFGDGFIERCLAAMRKPFMFGSGQGTPQPLQQSVFFVRKDGFRTLLSGLHEIGARDKIVYPEWKFLLASTGLTGVTARLMRSRSVRRLTQVTFLGSLLQGMGYDLLPFGFGRSRPLQAGLNHYYFQHGELTELRSYFQRLPATVRARVAHNASNLANTLEA